MNKQEVLEYCNKWFSPNYINWQGDVMVSHLPGFLEEEDDKIWNKLNDLDSDSIEYDRAADLATEQSNDLIKQVELNIRLLGAFELVERKGGDEYGSSRTHITIYLQEYDMFIKATGFEYSYGSSNWSDWYEAKRVEVVKYEYLPMNKDHE